MGNPDVFVSNRRVNQDEGDITTHVGALDAAVRGSPHPSGRA
jgi:hypothetical protein